MSNQLANAPPDGSNTTNSDTNKWLAAIKAPVIFLAKTLRLPPKHTAIAILAYFLLTTTTGYMGYSRHTRVRACARS